MPRHPQGHPSGLTQGTVPALCPGVLPDNKPCHHIRNGLPWEGIIQYPGAPGNPNPCKSSNIFNKMQTYFFPRTNCFVFTKPVIDVDCAHSENPSIKDFLASLPPRALIPKITHFSAKPIAQACFKTYSRLNLHAKFCYFIFLDEHLSPTPGPPLHLAYR